MCSLAHLHNSKVLVEVFDDLKGQRDTNPQCIIILYVKEKIKFVNGQMTDARGGYPQASEFNLITVTHILSVGSFAELLYLDKIHPTLLSAPLNQAHLCKELCKACIILARKCFAFSVHF